VRAQRIDFPAKLTKIVVLATTGNIGSQYFAKSSGLVVKTKENFGSV
jgi:hypothetical protein